MHERSLKLSLVYVSFIIPVVPAPLCGKRGGRGRRKRHLLASAHWSHSICGCSRGERRHLDTFYTGWGLVCGNSGCKNDCVLQTQGQVQTLRSWQRKNTQNTHFQSLDMKYCSSSSLCSQSSTIFSVYRCSIRHERILNTNTHTEMSHS